MKKKMFGIFVVTLLLVATGITVAGTLKLNTNSPNGGEGATGWGWYNPAGAWMRSDKKLVASISPAGLGRYSMSGQYLADDPSLWWLGIDATSLSIIVGEQVVAGKNKYELTEFAYAINDNYDIVYYAVYSGTVEMTSQDTSAAVFYAGFYSPDQDPFGEDPPNYGCFGPYEYTYERIPVVPPCEP